MAKFLRIAWHTYWQHLTRPFFLFLAFGLPLLGALLLVLAIYFAAHWQPTPEIIGYVDRAHVLSHIAYDPPAIRAFADESQAQRALEKGEIGAYYVIPPDYLISGQVRQNSVRSVSPLAHARFREFIRERLLDQTPRPNRRRIVEGTNVLHRALDGAPERRLRRVGPLLLILGMLTVFYILTQLTNSYLWRALSQEHSDRTIEIVLSSVSVEQLVAGKIAGILAWGLTPITVWSLVFGMIGWIVLTALRFFGFELAVPVPWNLLALGAAILFPAYVMDAAFTVLVGALTGAPEQTQPFPWLLNLLHSIAWFPLTLAALLAPESLLAIILSVVPFTAPVVLLVRMALVIVPLWQLVLAISLLWLTMALSVLLCARVYRAARLMAGQPRRLRTLIIALQGK